MMNDPPGPRVGSSCNDSVAEKYATRVTTNTMSKNVIARQSLALEDENNQRSRDVVDFENGPTYYYYYLRASSYFSPSVFSAFRDAKRLAHRVGSTCIAA